jgi:hypothetical protein
MNCAQVGVDIERASFVIFVERVVLLRKLLSVDNAELRHEATPFVVAVCRDERVIEIKKG